MILAADTLVAQNVGFGVLALMMVVAAFRVVTCNNVVHAALWLVMVMAGAAGQYLLLYAEFVAVTQVLIYVGAVMVLFLFGVMLTRARVGAEKDLDNRSWWIGIPVAVVLAGTMGYALVDGWRDTKVVDSAGSANAITTQAVSDDIFGPYLLPFWALSFVLLAAVIGAIVLARKD